MQSKRTSAGNLRRIAWRRDERCPPLSSSGSRHGWRRSYRSFLVAETALRRCASARALARADAISARRPHRLDTNPVERAIPPVALGRKNHLFAGSDGGGARWAVVGSLVKTCKLNGVEPYAYLKDVLERMADGYPANRVVYASGGDTSIRPNVRKIVIIYGLDVVLGAPCPRQQLVEPRDAAKRIAGEWMQDNHDVALARFDEEVWHVSD
jgi:hypothetical protein